MGSGGGHGFEGIAFEQHAPEVAVAAEWQHRVDQFRVEPASAPLPRHFESAIDAELSREDLQHLRQADDPGLERNARVR